MYGHSQMSYDYPIVLQTRRASTVLEAIGVSVVQIRTCDDVSLLSNGVKHYSVLTMTFGGGLYL